MIAKIPAEPFPQVDEAVIKKVRNLQITYSPILSARNRHTQRISWDLQQLNLSPAESPATKAQLLAGARRLVSQHGSPCVPFNDILFQQHLEPKKQRRRHSQRGSN